MEVEFISEEFIKPSSPTPSHLRHLNFSFLDQIQPHSFVPLLHFYSNKSNMNNSQTSNLLKKSLSKVLTIFYPVAGRINNNSYIECNDEGILFVEAKINCQLSDILRDRNPSNNNYFIPLKRLEEANELAAFSQITFFNCAGLVISFSMSHKLGDGLSMITFLQSWAAAASGRNIDLIKIPHFGSATLFPPINFSGRDPTTDIINKNQEKVITKLFVFDGSTLEALRAKYTVDNGGRLSRVEALASFIWSRFIAITRPIKANNNKRYRVMQAVNLRERMKPPLPMLAFGNYAIANAKDMNVEDTNGYHRIAKRVANSTRNVDANYVKMLQNKDEQSNYFKRIIEEFSNEEVVTFSLSSVQNFPIYETDFGWGKPLWFATTPMARKNLVLLFPRIDGRGVEAWISLKEEDMAKFEMDNQLLQQVSSTLDENHSYAFKNHKLDTHSRF